MSVPPRVLMSTESTSVTTRTTPALGSRSSRRLLFGCAVLAFADLRRSRRSQCRTASSRQRVCWAAAFCVAVGCAAW